jgi:hypothetical protein
VVVGGCAGILAVRKIEEGSFDCVPRPFVRKQDEWENDDREHSAQDDVRTCFAEIKVALSAR